MKIDEAAKKIARHYTTTFTKTDKEYLTPILSRLTVSDKIKEIEALLPSGLHDQSLMTTVRIKARREAIEEVLAILKGEHKRNGGGIA